ncbi:unnamed protein product [Euphydryas editha]|uniref:LRRCT domain-containing protein n=1 Tax=Euphydryas editha TaxID=104508 RepID=A0AAU9TNN2_EUPED|nr:unnamed protein product [Euphydryas editha]
MKLPKIEFLKKRNKCISSVIRNTSCSGGWLRLVVQIIFGSLIVTSFILIVLMALSSSRSLTLPVSKCATTSNCRVICNEVPYYGQHEDDIINTVSEVDPNCESIALKLNRPTFVNAEIPQHWLSEIRFNVRELTIVGGNARHITSSTFMSFLGSNLRTLILENIEINGWDKSTLIGFSELRYLYIKDCFLRDIRERALGVVRESLDLLDIKASNSFNPINLTGSVELKVLTVDFSFNNFNDILGPSSFTGLKYCKRLLLNFCQITALRPGTFDHLESIKELHLDNNNLITVPVGLFNKLLSLEPKIDLHGNNWHCDCSIKDLRNLLKQGLLIVDPICYYPDEVNGMTLSDFEGYCNETKEPITSDSMENENSYIHENICKTMPRIISLNSECSDKNSSRSSELKVISSAPPKCYLNRINNEDIKYINTKNGHYEKSVAWIKPVYSVQRNSYSMVEMKSSEQPGLGLLWYQSLCSKEIFCTNTIPDVLKVFNVDTKMQYTFCPFSLSNGTVQNNHCVSYNFFETSNTENVVYQELIIYICISLGCVLCGALFVYALIQRNPTLLKGNKRVILVKHKAVDALILPPQLPIRKEFLNELETFKSADTNKNKIFLLSDNSDKLSPNTFTRSISMKSTDSNDVSYISALQPTEEQLREWHSNQTMKQFDSKAASDTDTSPFSSIYDRDSLPYYSIHTSERFYEVPIRPE